jgi:GTP cyclohydrolase II
MGRKMENLHGFLKRLAEAAEFRRQHKRPFITVSYAQAMDGSIAMRLKKKVQLSSPAALKLTHRLRAAHDAILLGIGTVLLDNPFLTVRLVEGQNPLPIILDTRLRLHPGLNVMQRQDCKPLVVTGSGAAAGRIAEMERLGARVLACAVTPEQTIDLQAMMALLTGLDTEINSIMVEGGARVISGFTSAKLVDQFVITFTPYMLGGLKALELKDSERGEYVELADMKIDFLGEDLVMWARPVHCKLQNELR